MKYQESLLYIMKTTRKGHSYCGMLTENRKH